MDIVTCLFCRGSHKNGGTDSALSHISSLWRLLFALSGTREANGVLKTEAFFVHFKQTP